VTNASRLTWTVAIVDAAGAAVAGAKVKVSVASPSGTTTLLATTASNGVATFRMDVPPTGATYTLAVADVLLSGWTYDASANAAGSKALTA
jgi:hypothetical protein